MTQYTYSAFSVMSDDLTEMPLLELTGDSGQFMTKAAKTLEPGVYYVLRTSDASCRESDMEVKLLVTPNKVEIRTYSGIRLQTIYTGRIYSE